MFTAIRHRIRLWRSLRREKKKNRTRSPRWHVIQKKYLAKYPVCPACNSTEHMQVHHVKPVHLFPELEEVEVNLIGLCMGPKECHLRLGHGDDFKAYNPKIRSHVVLLATGFDRKLIDGFAKQARLYK